MPRLKREVSELLRRSINSLVLSIELFNRPYENGRSEAVLIFLHHAFEMLLKSIIRDQTGSIHGKGEKYSYGFDKCLEIVTNQLKIISSDDRATLSILDANRDIAIHYYQSLSEDLLYLHAQSGVTLFDEILKKVFKKSLSNFIQDRILPISTRPPKDLQILIDNELAQVDEIINSGKRKGIQAAEKLRPILAIAAASRDITDRVSERELRSFVKRRKLGEKWSVIFPEIAQLRLDTKGEGLPVYIKIKKSAQSAVRIAKPGEPVVGTIIKQEYDWFDKYNLSVSDIAVKLNLTVPKTRAYMFEINVWDDPDMFSEKRVKSILFKRYTKKALDALREVRKNIDVETIWERQKMAVLGKKH